MRKLKHREVSDVRDTLQRAQNNKCALCKEPLKVNGKPKDAKEPVLDHCHQTGKIRAVLCRNCNGMEGKIWNIANRSKQNLEVTEWLQRVVDYIEIFSKTAMSSASLVHPTHKTEAEKRDARNAKARARRAALKTGK